MMMRKVAIQPFYSWKTTGEYLCYDVTEKSWGLKNCHAQDSPRWARIWFLKNKGFSNAYGISQRSFLGFWLYRPFFERLMSYFKKVSCLFWVLLLFTANQVTQFTHWPNATSQNPPTRHSSGLWLAGATINIRAQNEASYSLVDLSNLEPSFVFWRPTDLRL